MWKYGYVLSYFSIVVLMQQLLESVVFLLLSKLIFNYSFLYKYMQLHSIL